MNKGNAFLTSCMVGLSFAFVMCGIGFLMIGILAVDYAHRYKPFLGNKYYIAPVIVIIVGFVILISACNGFYGVITKRAFLLIAFVLMFSALFCAEIAAVVCAYIYRDEIKITLENTLITSLKCYEADKSINDLWNYMQQTFECCGVKDFTDYLRLNITLPSSCCSSKGRISCKDITIIHGCVTALYDTLSSHLVLFIVFAIVIALIQLVTLAIATFLAYTTLNKEDYSKTSMESSEGKDIPEKTENSKNENVVNGGKTYDKEDYFEENEDYALIIEDLTNDVTTTPEKNP